MDWDDELDNGYGDVNDTLHRDNSIHDKIDSDGGIDPLNITNPVSAYFFLSDDAQDEISGRRRKNMKCGSCSHRFAGESYESCPECFSPDTEELEDEHA